jgi:hypothetical protein
MIIEAENDYEPAQDCVIDSEHSRPLGKEWIYGLYLSSSECIYVGRTVDFRGRWKAHRTYSEKNWKIRGNDLIMLPLELVPTEIAGKRERFHQFSFEKIGMAKLSMAFWRSKSTKSV